MGTPPRHHRWSSIPRNIGPKDRRRIYQREVVGRAMQDGEETVSSDVGFLTEMLNEIMAGDEILLGF